MKNRRRVVLRVEELESRLVPSAVTQWESTNWSGYAVSPPPAGQVVSEVVGQWVVPAVTGTGTADSATWVGIDGFSSKTVEQIGTASNLVNGVPQYYAWWEMYPANAMQEIPGFAVSPGDTITATVTYDGTVGSSRSKADQFTLTITDQPANGNKVETFTEVSSLNGVVALSSAEWIEEAPSSNRGVLTLANFGSVTFTNAQAATTASGTTGGTLENIGWYSAVDEIDMINSRGTEIIAATSGLNGAGNSFTVAYGSTTPDAPNTIANKKYAGAIEQVLEVQQVAPGLVPLAQVLVTSLPSGRQNTILAAGGAIHQGGVDASQALSAFFAGNIRVGGMDAPGNDSPDAGIRMDGEASAPDSSDLQWFAPSLGSGAMAPPAVIPPSETGETTQEMSVMSVEGAAPPYLAGSKWNADPGSTREQSPTYASDVPIQSVVFVLLGSVLSGRRRTSTDENKAKARLRSM